MALPVGELRGFLGQLPHRAPQSGAYFPQRAGGDAAHNGQGGHIPCHHRSGGDNGPSADGHAGHHSDIGPPTRHFRR